MEYVITVVQAEPFQEISTLIVLLRLRTEVCVLCCSFRYLCSCRFQKEIARGELEQAAEQAAEREREKRAALSLTVAKDEKDPAGGSALQRGQFVQVSVPVDDLCVLAQPHLLAT